MQKKIPYYPLKALSKQNFDSFFFVNMQYYSHRTFIKTLFKWHLIVASGWYSNLHTYLTYTSNKFYTIEINVTVAIHNLRLVYHVSTNRGHFFMYINVYRCTY